MTWERFFSENIHLEVEATRADDLKATSFPPPPAAGGGGPWAQARPCAHARPWGESAGRCPPPRARGRSAFLPSGLFPSPQRPPPRFRGAAPTRLCPGPRPTSRGRGPDPALCPHPLARKRRRGLAVVMATERGRRRLSPALAPPPAPRGGASTLPAASVASDLRPLPCPVAAPARARSSSPAGPTCTRDGLSLLLRAEQTHGTSRPGGPRLSPAYLFFSYIFCLFISLNKLQRQRYTGSLGVEHP